MNICRCSTRHIILAALETISKTFIYRVMLLHWSVLEHLPEPALFVELTHYLEPAHETLHDVELGGDAELAVVEKGRPDLRILVQVKAVQILLWIVIARIFHYLHDLL